jgi:hypothetical protein
MSSKKSMDTRARKKRGTDQTERPATPAESLSAVITLIRQNAFQYPRNPLVEPNPATTINSCRKAIDFLSHIEQPFTGADMDLAEMFIVRMVRDALEHAESVTTALFNAASAGYQ